MIKKKRRKKEMDCPYLTSRPQRECGAASRGSKGIAPVNMGFDEYCHNEEHYRCPMALARALQGERLVA